MTRQELREWLNKRIYAQGGVLHGIDDAGNHRHITGFGPVEAALIVEFARDAFMAGHDEGRAAAVNEAIKAARHKARQQADHLAEQLSAQLVGQVEQVQEIRYIAERESEGSDGRRILSTFTAPTAEEALAGLKKVMALHT